MSNLVIKNQARKYENSSIKSNSTLLISKENPSPSFNDLLIGLVKN